MTENKASFFARLEPRLAPSEVTKIRGAYYLAKFGHRAQLRKELDDQGNPLRYFEHVRRTALILMDEAKVFNPDLICTALLHDCLEDTQDINDSIIEQFFGADVARRVRILTKDPKEGYIERLASADEETLLVKACDRLDNLRSMDDVSVEFKEKQRQETIDKYLPIYMKRFSRDRPVYKIVMEILDLIYP